MAMASGNSQGSGPAPIRVGKDMIEFIKLQGMTRALKRAGEMRADKTKGEAEFLEGVRRMYGAKRVSAATKAATPKKGSYTAGSIPGSKSKMDSRFAGTKKPTTGKK